MMSDARLVNLLTTLRGDLSGAISAAIITLPMSIGYGFIAFAPLGVEFLPKAALLGVYSAIFSGIFAGILGGTPIQISGPKAPLTLILGTFLAGMTAKLTMSPQSELQPEVILGLGAACVMIAGFSQIVLGILGAGKLIKYVPQPVIAGFMNGIAFLLIVKQTRTILGIKGGTPFSLILQHPDLINPITALTGIVTIAANIIAKRYVKRIPASLTALVVGTALYYLLTYFEGGSGAGNLIGRLDTTFPQPNTIIALLPAVKHTIYGTLLPELVMTGLIIGMLASMESLMASVVSDNTTGSRHSSKRELIGQGFGNIVCGLFGALPAAGSIPRSLANYKAGGRTRASGILCSILIFLMITFLGPVVSSIPLTVIAGIIFVVGVNLFDRWSLNQLRCLLTSLKFHKELITDLIITLTVAVVTVSINLIAAVAIGTLIASAIFVSRISRSIIKRKFSGDQYHSRKMRSRKHTEFLEKAGDRTMVFELQGPLFFGSAENLAVEIEKSLLTTEYCILNFKRVNDIDSTGANILAQIKRQLETTNKHLLLAHLKENKHLWNFLEVMKVNDLINSSKVFPDTDTALEWTEDMILGKLEEHQTADQKSDISQFELFRDFSKEELNTVKTMLSAQTYDKGQLIFEEGDDNRDLYLLAKGSMSVKIYLPERNYYKRIYTYTSGVVFGEMAFLDGLNRSASVWAHEDSEVYCMPFSLFQALRNKHPEIASKLIINLSLELNRRLRRTSDQLSPNFS